jgi:hypothetical protein
MRRSLIMQRRILNALMRRRLLFAAPLCLWVALLFDWRFARRMQNAAIPRAGFLITTAGAGIAEWIPITGRAIAGETATMPQRVIEAQTMAVKREACMVQSPHRVVVRASQPALPGLDVCLKHALALSARSWGASSAGRLVLCRVAVYKGLKGVAERVRAEALSVGLYCAWVEAAEVLVSERLSERGRVVAID